MAGDMQKILKSKKENLIYKSIIANSLILLAVSAIFINNGNCSSLFGLENDPVNEAYKYGEPDYSDGDLEDKLGDSGYYADLFPEDVEDDYSDSNIENSGSVKTDINNPITIYSNDVAGSGIGYSSFGSSPAFIQGTSANIAGKVAGVGNVASGVYVIGDKIYYFKENNVPFNGWLQVGNNWYYFDDYMIRNELKNINNKVYYFFDDGKMAINQTFDIGGIKFSADFNGCVEKISN